MSALTQGAFIEVVTLQEKMSRVGLLRHKLRGGTETSESDSAARSEAMASILSSGAQWVLDCCDIEERCRYATHLWKCHMHILAYTKCAEEF